MAAAIGAVEVELPFGRVVDGVEGVDFSWILVERRGVTEAIATTVA